MITVLKHGNTMKTCTCQYCGCVFMYHTDDIENDADRFGNDTIYIGCPECGANLVLDDGEE